MHIVIKNKHFKILTSQFVEVVNSQEVKDGGRCGLSCPVRQFRHYRRRCDVRGTAAWSRLPHRPTFV